MLRPLSRTLPIGTTCTGGPWTPTTDTVPPLRGIDGRVQRNRVAGLQLEPEAHQRLIDAPRSVAAHGVDRTIRAAELGDLLEVDDRGLLGA